MCKVFAITNMSKVKLNRRLITTVNQFVTKHDNDGFGYAVLGSKGNIGGERTLKPKSFLPLENISEKVMYKVPFVTKSKNGFGQIDVKNPKAFIGHGRWSTNVVNLENTHPFVNSTTALIHNGVVNNASGEELNLKTSCDTEILLKQWEKGGMKAIEENVSGYYAMAIIETNGLLHIIRDDVADLFWTWSPTIESFIFATTPEIIEGVAKSMKWKIEEMEELHSNTHMIFDGNTIVSETGIVPIGRTWGRTMTDVERRALGHTGTGYGRSAINEADYEDPTLGEQWTKKFYGHGAKHYQFNDNGEIPSHKEYYEQYDKDGIDGDEYTEQDHINSFIEDEETKEVLAMIMAQNHSKKKIG